MHMHSLSHSLHSDACTHARTHSVTRPKRLLEFYNVTLVLNAYEVALYHYWAGVLGSRMEGMWKLGNFLLSGEW